MASVARVVIDISLERVFDYLIPDELRARVFVGSRVAVSFGKSTSKGYVVSLSEDSEREGLKRILSIEGDRPYFDRALLSLAEWMAGYYGVTVERVIRAMLPGAVRKRGARFKQRLYVSVSDNVEDDVLSNLSAKQRSALDWLKEQGGGFLSHITVELGITAAPVKALQRKGFVTITPATSERSPLGGRKIIRTRPLTLMPQQAEALLLIERAVDGQAKDGGRQMTEEEISARDHRAEPHVVLLHGVTGSGKTEVYLQAIAEILKEGKGAIVLVPEISLTPQTVERFHGRFGDTIAVLHSHLSEGERHDEWHRIQRGDAQIVVGARSAVFAPVKNLGLMVVDEEHENSYKQEDAPRYNARDVAVMRGHMQGFPVVLGSATPSLESWQNAKIGKYTLASLPRRVDHRKMPVMRVVDMRLEAERTGHVSAFSSDLLEAIRKRLDAAEQVILFLNRRGFATSLICPKCGYVAGCDLCSVSYTYHKKADELRCHICGAVRRTPQKCPECSDRAFKFAGIGTQRIESILTKCFPHASIQRMDADVTTRKDAYERILGDFKVGKTNILIGTQMIAKGLHFPNVTLVGVVYADLSLHLPDFRSGERTFQLLAQVAGRAGRGEVSGEVIVQTYTPHHPAIQAVRRLDYEGFCDQELEFRKELSYPPFSHLVCLTFRGKDEDKTAFCAGTLSRALKREAPEHVIVSEAAPAPLARAKGKYRYQVITRSVSVSSMVKAVRTVGQSLKMPKGVTFSVDVDALNLL